MIMEGEKKYFEDNISELESRESATSQQMEELRTQVEELVAQKGSLEAQIMVENEGQLDITPFRAQACTIRRNIHQVQINLSGEIYKVNTTETRLNEIVANSLNFITRMIEVAKKVQIHLTWVEAILMFPEHLP